MCVQVPCSCYGGSLWVRISAQYYNSLRDYRALATAVNSIAGAQPIAGVANGSSHLSSK